MFWHAFNISMDYCIHKYDAWHKRLSYEIPTVPQAVKLALLYTSLKSSAIPVACATISNFFVFRTSSTLVLIFCLYLSCGGCEWLLGNCQVGNLPYKCVSQEYISVLENDAVLTVVIKMNKNKQFKSKYYIIFWTIVIFIELYF